MSYLFHSNGGHKYINELIPIEDIEDQTEKEIFTNTAMLFAHVQLKRLSSGSYDISSPSRPTSSALSSYSTPLGSMPPMSKLERDQDPADSKRWDCV